MIDHIAERRRLNTVCCKACATKEGGIDIPEEIDPVFVSGMTLNQEKSNGAFVGWV